MFIERVFQKQRKAQEAELQEREAKFQKAVEEASEKARLEGIEQGKVIGASEKQEEWEEWADNGREDSNRPKPPNPQNSDKIKV